VLQRLRLNCASSDWLAITKPVPRTKATATTRITMRFMTSPSLTQLVGQEGSPKTCRNAMSVLTFFWISSVMW
jgi:hypothetical protein